MVLVIAFKAHNDSLRDCDSFSKNDQVFICLRDEINECCVVERGSYGIAEKTDQYFSANRKSIERGTCGLLLPFERYNEQLNIGQHKID